MMRSTLIAAVLCLCAISAAHALCEGEDQTIDFGGNLEAREFVLKTRGCSSDQIKYRITGMPMKTLNPSGKSIGIKGTPQLKSDERPVTGVFRLSDPQMNNEKYGAANVQKIKVWPAYGDSDNNYFLIQQGDKNWVEYTVQEFYKLKTINAYEVLNPGGITRVELLTERETYLVWDKDAKSDAAFDTQVTFEDGKDGDSTTGSRKTTWSFNPPTFVPTLVRFTIDASAKWRGIDYLTLGGEIKEFPELPGNLNDNKIVLAPTRPWGCDTFRYQVFEKEWSGDSQVKVCFGAPPGKNGKMCSGNGSAKLGACECQTSPAFQGVTCETPKCPGDLGNGVVCNGRGRCGGPKDTRHICDCDPAFTGPGCKWQKFASHCHFVGDPHWATFDAELTGDRTYYNMYTDGEFLDYYMNDPDLNPDMETIGHAQAHPWAESPVAANQWIVFRKANDFVQVYNSGDIRVGRKGGACYPGNVAGEVDAMARQGQVYTTPDGLSIRRVGGGWRVASDVEGKNPTGTVLGAYGGWLYLDGYIWVNTARVGKAVGLCGNYDGQGNDLGNYWRYGEPEPQITNALAIPASKSLGACKGAMEKVVTMNLLSEVTSIQPALTLADQKEMLKYITKGGSGANDSNSEFKNRVFKDLASGVKSRKISGKTMVTLVGTRAEVEARAEAEAKLEAAKAENIDDALKGCGSTPVAADVNPKLTQPLTREHLALDDCFNRLLKDTPAAQSGDDIVRAAKTSPAGARQAIAILDRFPQWSTKKEDYLNCIVDVCASGIVEKWENVNAEDVHLDNKSRDTEEQDIDETQRIEDRQLIKQ